MRDRGTSQTINRLFLALPPIVLSNGMVESLSFLLASIRAHMSLEPYLRQMYVEAGAMLKARNKRISFHRLQ